MAVAQLAERGTQSLCRRFKSDLLSWDGGICRDTVLVKSQYLYWFSPLPAGSIPAAAYLSTLAAHERQGLSFQMSKAAVVLGNNRNTGTQRGKMTRKIFCVQLGANLTQEKCQRGRTRRSRLFGCMAQWQSTGLLIRIMWVRFPPYPPSPMRL